MARVNLFGLARTLPRSVRLSSIHRSLKSPRRSLFASIPMGRAFRPASFPALRPFSTTIMASKGLSPESENPQPKEAEDQTTVTSPTDITMEEYHQLSDAYMDSIVSKMEQLQEAREDVDVEFSAGVLTLAFPPTGTYVLNKQPPNKQIWLSSPISGPKRYDWVISGEGQHEKEGGGTGDWIYLRDGTSLNELLMKELQVDLTADITN